MCVCGGVVCDGAAHHVPTVVPRISVQVGEGIEQVGRD